MNNLDTRITTPQISRMSRDREMRKNIVGCDNQHHHNIIPFSYLILPRTSQHAHYRFMNSEAELKQKLSSVFDRL
jgi:hypothetical protein